MTADQIKYLYELNKSIQIATDGNDQVYVDFYTKKREEFLKLVELEGVKA